MTVEARYGQNTVEVHDEFGPNYGSLAARQGLRSVAVYFDSVRNPLVKRVLVVGRQRWTNGEACGERRFERRKEEEEEENDNGGWRDTTW